MAQHEQFIIDRMEEATRKLRSSQSPEEQKHWAQEVQSYAQQISPKKQSRTGFMVEADAPSTETAQQLLKQVEQGQLQGIREITYRRDADGTGRIRVSASREVLPQATQVLNPVAQQVERSFTRSSSSSS